MNKTLNIMAGISFILFLTTLALGQEKWDWEQGGWVISIQRKNVPKTPVAPMLEIKRIDIDDEPDIQLWKTPDIPIGAPSAGKLVEYTNLVVEKFNADKINELPDIFTKEWMKLESSLKNMYTGFDPCIRIVYGTEQETGKVKPVFVWITSTVEYTLRGSSSETKHHANFNLFVHFLNGKVQAAGGYYPLVNEDYCALMRRTKRGGLQYLTFSYKDWPKKGEEKPTPWIIWNKEGKIIENTSNILKFEDYEPLTFVGSHPQFRDVPLEILRNSPMESMRHSEE